MAVSAMQCSLATWKVSVLLSRPLVTLKSLIRILSGIPSSISDLDEQGNCTTGSLIFQMRHKI